MRAIFSTGLSLRNAVVIGLLAGAGAIAAPSLARAESNFEVGPEQSVALEADALDVAVPEELEDLREIGQQISDRLSKIDPELLKQVMQPLGREALRIFLDSAPGLSQKAIELGEQGLNELEKRAMEGLEQAQEGFELGAEAEL